MGNLKSISSFLLDASSIDATVDKLVPKFEAADFGMGGECN
tara:strand:+ start:624 stop:746 length:123 start_codon:yes stop_codon:yes gene_type:complete